MSKVIFYPLGNADCCLLHLNNEMMFVFDYADMNDPDDRADQRLPLAKHFKEDIGWPKRKHVDVLAFTHGDTDHVKRSSEIFWFNHAAKYQDDERVKFTQLWVPAALIVEEGCEDETRIIRAEARHRFLNKEGILVFARLEHLKVWLEGQGKNLGDYLDAALRIYCSDPNGVTRLIEPPLSAPRRLRVNDWTICIDGWLVDKLARFRSSRLPNETGGVLLGAFDTHNRTCQVIDALPSPPDSTEWPTTYIRGCEGLAAQVTEIGKQTLGQVRYVGEWHSHPKGAAVRPSGDDLRAYEWLVGHMHLESLPGLMLIIGDRKRICLVSTEPS